MLRLVAIAVFLFALACGGDESGRTVGEAGEEEAPWTEAEETTPSAEYAEPAQLDHPSVQSCLDLVGAGRFAEAVPPCTEAVRQAPGNREVADALEKARSRAAEEAAKKAAAGAAGEASEAAGAEAQDLSKGLTEKLP